VGFAAAGASDLLLPQAVFRFIFFFTEREVFLVFMNPVLSSVKPGVSEDPPGRQESRRP
jgi:hypothetical protein